MAEFVFLFSTLFSQLTRLFATRRLFALRMFYIGAHQPLFPFPFLFTLLLLLLLLSILSPASACQPRGQTLSWLELALAVLLLSIIY